MVPFILDISPTPGSVILHSTDKEDPAVYIGIRQLREQLWDRISDVIGSLGSEVGKIKANFSVDEISVSLGLTAKGGLAFVAEASGQAVFTVKLKRKA